MYMSTAFISAVEEHLSHVTVVFDHYHVSALMNKGIANLRREQQPQLDEGGDKVFQGGSQTAEYVAPKAKYCWKRDSILDACGNEDQDL